MKCIKDFGDYEVLDMANGQKLERWNNILLSRPDPQIIWNQKSRPSLWDSVDAKYSRSKTGGGEWHIFNKDMPTSWTVNWKDLTFNLKLMGFKHTGLFPEQAVNWNYMYDKIKNSKRSIKVLNLFAYTGAASVFCLSAGASVVHVDSSRGMVDWAKENVKVNNLDDKPIRFIVDDVVKFVKREIRRGNKYDGIVMDPPSYGKGANGEIWSLEKDLFNLINLCQELLSDNPLFFIVNSYSGLSPIIVENILKLTNKRQNANISSFEIGLPITNNNLTLPCGITGLIEYE